MTPAARPVATRGLHHYAIGVQDLDRSIAWYGDVFGLTLERRFGFPEAGIEIAHVAHESGLRIELIRQAGSTAGPDVAADQFSSLQVRGAKHIGVLVDDLDQAWATLTRLGVETVAPPTEVAPAGVRNCWARDPDGTLVEFNEWLDPPGGPR